MAKIIHPIETEIGKFPIYWGGNSLFLMLVISIQHQLSRKRMTAPISSVLIFSSRMVSKGKPAASTR